MNDRFRFRAWDKKNKRMLYNIQEAYDGGCIEDKEGEFIEDYIGVCCFASFFPYEGKKENHYIVEQCTGLKDKNGKLIYEGDIVKMEAGFMCADIEQVGKPCIVEWGDFGFYFHYPQIEGEKECACWNECAEYEVIGNIHENPELLEAVTNCNQ